jgi:purine-binding chemotaxis protein CheW
MSATNDNRTRVAAGLGANPCVTVLIGAQRLAIPIARVEDIFAVQSATAVPLAPDHVAGLINLRGKIVTGIHLSRRLGLPAQENGARLMAINIGHHGETIGLLVSNVGDVLEFPPENREQVPGHLHARWAQFAAGVHQRDGELVIELDVESIVALPARGEAA